MDGNCLQRAQSCLINEISEEKGFHLVIVLRQERHGFDQYDCKQQGIHYELD